MNVTIVTGLSGAGRSSALKTLEDMGFFCTDNIPPKLIPSFIDLCKQQVNPPKNVAVVADMRMGDMFDSIYEAIDQLQNMDVQLDILFLDASDEVLVSRFTQTRRQHPVSGSGKILSGILIEREKLQRIKEMANIVIDTSTYSPRTLSVAIQKKYQTPRSQQISISVITFGYKRGIPIDADLVFDVRFLPNPFYNDELKIYSGLTDTVRDYVMSFESASVFLNQLQTMVEYLSPLYLEQDKKQLVIAIGCTGGMHRSVVLGEALYQRLAKGPYQVSIEHRDVNIEGDSISQRFSELTEEM